MPFSHGRLGHFGLGTAGTPGTPVDISSYITDVSMPRDVKMLETTCLGKTYQTWIAGFIGGTITLTGIFDPLLDIQMSALLSVNNVSFEYGPQGTTAGLVKYTGT